MRRIERQVVPDGGTRNRKRPLADCRETNKRNGQMCEVEDRGRRLDVMSETRVIRDCK